MLWNASIKRSLLILRCMVPPSESHFDWGKMFLAQENCISRFARWQLAGLSNKFEHYFAKLPNRYEFLGCAQLRKPAINCCCYLAVNLEQMAFQPAHLVQGSFLPRLKCSKIYIFHVEIASKIIRIWIFKVNYLCHKPSEL